MVSVALGLGLGLASGLGLAGCASPGPPKPPSLHLPKPANDLVAERVGDGVVLRFTTPQRSTDGLPLPKSALTVRVCRALEHARCEPVAALTRTVMPSTDDAAAAVELKDALGGELAAGPARLLAYRVTLANAEGRDAGASEPAFTAAGTAPAAVAGFRAEGSRLGVVLRWQGQPEDAAAVVMARDTDMPAAKPQPRAGDVPAGRVELAANGVGQTLDGAVKPGVAYRYTAERRARVQLGGRTVELRSGPSDVATITLTLQYPPLAPTGLSAVGFATEAAASGGTVGFAVDVNWQSADEAGLLAGLAGYNVYRETLDASGAAIGARVKLNQQLVAIPAFHDPTAVAGVRYRYSVTSVDGAGNESAAAMVVWSPQS